MYVFLYDDLYWQVQSVSTTPCRPFAYSQLSSRWQDCRRTWVRIPYDLSEGRRLAALNQLFAVEVVLVSGNGTRISALPERAVLP